MGIKHKDASKIIKKAALAFAAGSAALAVLPYALPKGVSSNYKRKSQKRSFHGHGSTDRVQLVEMPQHAFDVRIELVNQARHTLDISCHTIGHGKTTESFFGQVIKAANRGVKVRVIIDGKAGGMNFGSNSHIGMALSLHPNIEYKLYNTINILKPWQWNSLLHDKFIIADNRYTLLGGRNIGDVYFDPSWHKGRVSHDRDVLVYSADTSNKTSAVVQNKKYMEHLWHRPESKTVYPKLRGKKRLIAKRKYTQLLEVAKELEEKRPELFGLWDHNLLLKRTVPTKKVSLIANPVHTLKKEPWVGYELMKMALGARRSVFMQTPYATANKDLLEIMNYLGKSGMDFKMLTNSVGSSPNFPAYSNYYKNREQFAKTGVKIYEFQNQISALHSKSYIFDKELSVIGSFNLDDRSFYIDTETMLVIHSREFGSVLEKTLENWKDQSLLVSSENVYAPNQKVEETPASPQKIKIMEIASVFSRMFEFLV